MLWLIKDILLIIIAIAIPILLLCWAVKIVARLVKTSMMLAFIGVLIYVGAMIPISMAIINVVRKML